MLRGNWNGPNGSLFTRELECSGKQGNQYPAPTQKPVPPPEPAEAVAVETDARVPSDCEETVIALPVD